MCLRIFVPTQRRIALFIFFAALPAISLILGITPFQMFFGLPYYLLRVNSIVSVAAQLVYSYILACIYAAAYVNLEASLRRNYPRMSYAAWKRRHGAATEPAPRKKPTAEPKARRKKR